MTIPFKEVTRPLLFYPFVRDIPKTRLIMGAVVIVCPLRLELLMVVMTLLLWRCYAQMSTFKHLTAHLVLFLNTDSNQLINAPFSPLNVIRKFFNCSNYRGQRVKHLIYNIVISRGNIHLSQQQKVKKFSKCHPDSTSVTISSVRKTAQKICNFFFICLLNFYPITSRNFLAVS